VQDENDLRPDPAELQDSQSEEELDWDGDPDDLMGVLVEVKRQPPEPSEG
jgi:hypothetical protein